MLKSRNDLHSCANSATNYRANYTLLPQISPKVCSPRFIFSWYFILTSFHFDEINDFILLFSLAEIVISLFVP